MGVSMGEPWEADCLAFDPFSGDFGGSGQGDRVLSDKIVTARKGGECHTCTQEIVSGERVRRMAEVYDNELMRFSWCEACCRAMAVDDDGDTYEKRVSSGQLVRADGETP